MLNLFTCISILDPVPKRGLTSKNHVFSKHESCFWKSHNFYPLPKNRKLPLRILIAVQRRCQYHLAGARRIARIARLLHKADIIEIHCNLTAHKLKAVAYA